MDIQQVTVKGVLSKSKLPESSYSINPYIGCLHGCIYCYARFMNRFRKNKMKWGEYLDIKVNAASVLEKDLSRARFKDTDAILLSSVTDPYQPMERKYKVTRSVLEVLLKHQAPISILTKSDLVLRDMDLLTKFDNCEVGISVAALDDHVSKVFEPRASSPMKRVKALRILHNHGVRTYVFISPILPFFTILEEIFTNVWDIADTVMAESLNTQCGNWLTIEETLHDNFPSLYQQFCAEAKNKFYWDKIGYELAELSSRFNKSLRGYYNHSHLKESLWKKTLQR